MAEPSVIPVVLNDKKSNDSTTFVATQVYIKRICTLYWINKEKYSLLTCVQSFKKAEENY